MWIEDGVTAGAGAVAAGEGSFKSGATVGAEAGLSVPLEQGPGLADLSCALNRVHGEHGNAHVRDEVFLKIENILRYVMSQIQGFLHF